MKLVTWFPWKQQIKIKYLSKVKYFIPINVLLSMNDNYGIIEFDTDLAFAF